jgi:hypothetical protein
MSASEPAYKKQKVMNTAVGSVQFKQPSSLASFLVHYATDMKDMLSEPQIDFFTDLPYKEGECWEFCRSMSIKDKDRFTVLDLDIYRNLVMDPKNAHLVEELLEEIDGLEFNTEWLEYLSENDETLPSNVQRLVHDFLLRDNRSFGELIKAAKVIDGTEQVHAPIAQQAEQVHAPSSSAQIASAQKKVEEEKRVVLTESGGRLTMLPVVAQLFSRCAEALREAMRTHMLFDNYLLSQLNRPTLKVHEQNRSVHEFWIKWKALDVENVIVLDGLEHMCSINSDNQYGLDCAMFRQRLEQSEQWPLLLRIMEYLEGGFENMMWLMDAIGEVENDLTEEERILVLKFRLRKCIGFMGLFKAAHATTGGYMPIAVEEEEGDSVTSSIPKNLQSLTPGVAQLLSYLTDALNNSLAWPYAFWEINGEEERNQYIEEGGVIEMQFWDDRVDELNNEEDRAALMALRSMCTNLDDHNHNYGLNRTLFQQRLAQPDQWPLLMRMMLVLENIDVEMERVLKDESIGDLPPDADALRHKFLAAEKTSIVDLVAIDLAAIAQADPKVEEAEEEEMMVMMEDVSDRRVLTEEEKVATIARNIKTLALESIRRFQVKSAAPITEFNVFNVWHDGVQEMSTHDFLVNHTAEQMRYTTLPVWIDTTDHFNIPVMQWVAANADTIAGSVHQKTSSFELTPAQMVAIYYIAYGSLTKIAYGYTMRKEAVLNANVVELYPGEKFSLTDCHSVLLLDHEVMPSKLRIVTFPMGTGKTIITVAAMQLVLFTPLGQKIARQILKQASRDHATGYSRVQHAPDVAAMVTERIAPLVVFFVPNTVIDHWIRTMIDAQAECERLFHRRVRIWKGNSIKKDPKSVKLVFDDMEPTFWVLPLVPKSLDVLYEHADIAVSGVVYDEMNKSMAKKGIRLRSHIAGPVVVPQATIESLKSGMETHQGNNFLASILGKGAMHSAAQLTRNIANRLYPEAQRALVDMASMRLSLPPETLMTMMASSSSHKMPAGIRIYNMTGNPTYAAVVWEGILAMDATSEIDILANRAANHGNFQFKKRDTYVKDENDGYLKVNIVQMEKDGNECLSKNSIIAAHLKQYFREEFKTFMDPLRKFIVRCGQCEKFKVFNKHNGAAVCSDPNCNLYIKPSCKTMTTTPSRSLPLSNIAMHEKFSALVSTSSKYTSMELVVSALKVMVEADSKASILLFAKGVKQDFMQLLHTELPNMEVVDFETSASKVRAVDQVIARYTDEHRTDPMLLFCRMQRDSRTIFGVDLKNTTGVVIYGSMPNDQSSQVIGRVLRMSNKTTKKTIPFINVR